MDIDFIDFFLWVDLELKLRMIALVDLVGLLEEEFVECPLGDDIKARLLINEFINIFEIVAAFVSILDLVRQTIHYDSYWELLVELFWSFESSRVEERT